MARLTKYLKGMEALKTLDEVKAAVSAANRDLPRGTGSYISLSPDGSFTAYKGNEYLDKFDSLAEAKDAILNPSKDQSDDYRGQHRAPMKGDGSPLHQMDQESYPEDIYSSKGLEYYGTGNRSDAESMAIIQSVRGNPDAKVKMYRAVPKSAEEMADQLEADMKQFMRRGNVPNNAINPKGLDGSDWYNWASDYADEIREQGGESITKINSGDWVTLSKNYAHEHGRAALNGQYRIISKTVPARKLFTEGNSLSEFGYDMKGSASLKPISSIAAASSLAALGGAALAPEAEAGPASGLKYGIQNLRTMGKLRKAARKAGLDQDQISMRPDGFIEYPYEWIDPLSDAGAGDVRRQVAINNDAVLGTDTKGEFGPNVWHHGGPDAINEFDRGYSGMTTANNEEEVFFFSDQEGVAEDYSREAFNRRYQDNPEMLVEDGIIEELPEFEGYQDQYDFVDELAMENLKVQSVQSRAKNPLVVDWGGEMFDSEKQNAILRYAKTGYIGDDYDLIADIVDENRLGYRKEDIDEHLEEVTEMARAEFDLDEGDEVEDWMIETAADYVLPEYGVEPQRYDAVIFENIIDSIGEGSSGQQTTMMALEAEDLRSPEAAFDPQFKGSKNLLGNASPDLVNKMAKWGLAGAAGAAGVAQMDDADAMAFIGPKAALYSMDAMKHAKQMQRKGASRDQIWQETGEKFGTPTFLDGDGYWKQEISDDLLQMKKDIQSGTVSDAMVHEKLFEAYPDLKDVDFLYQPTKSSIKAAYTPYQDRGDDLFPITEEISVFDEADVASNTMHEVQHAIQNREGFGRGGDTTDFYMDAKFDKEEAERQISKLNALMDENVRTRDAMKANGATEAELKPWADLYQNLMEERSKYIPAAQTDPLEYAQKRYERIGGEAEARNVQTRLPMTMEQRMAKPPWKTLDVPEDEVNYDSGGSGAANFSTSDRNEPGPAQRAAFRAAVDLDQKGIMPDKPAWQADLHNKAEATATMLSGMVNMAIAGASGADEFMQGGKEGLWEGFLNPENEGFLDILKQGRRTAAQRGTAKIDEIMASQPYTYEPTTPESVKYQEELLQGAEDIANFHMEGMGAKWLQDQVEKLPEFMGFDPGEFTRGMNPVENFRKSADQLGRVSPGAGAFLFSLPDLVL